jgi:hypothetical protein
VSQAQVGPGLRPRDRLALAIKRGDVCVDRVEVLQHVGKRRLSVPVGEALAPDPGPVDLRPASLGLEAVPIAQELLPDAVARRAPSGDGLDAIACADRHERGRDDVAGDADPLEQAQRVVAAGTGLVADGEAVLAAEPLDERAQRALRVRDLLELQLAGAGVVGL